MHSGAVQGVGVWVRRAPGDVWASQLGACEGSRALCAGLRVAASNQAHEDLLISFRRYSC